MDYMMYTIVRVVSLVNSETIFIALCDYVSFIEFIISSKGFCNNQRIAITVRTNVPKIMHLKTQIKLQLKKFLEFTKALKSSEFFGKNSNI